MLKLFTANVDEPITLGQAKAAMNVDFTRDDALLSGLIVSARQAAENETGRCLMASTWDLYLDDWPGGIEIALPIPPLTSITSVKYYDSAAVQQTLSAAKYVVDANSEPGRIWLVDGESWPDLQQQRPSPIVIRFVAGYVNAAAVPQSIRDWIKAQVAQGYHAAQGLLPTTQIALAPFVDRLLDPYRLRPL